MFKESKVRGVMISMLFVLMMVTVHLTSSYGADEATIKQLKEKLIIANRVLGMEKLATPFGHISVRIPGTETFLITRGVAPAMATLEDIVVCNMDGKVIEGKYKSTYGEIFAHTEVYKNRKDFNSVIHTHSPYVIAMSMTGNTLEPDIRSLVVGPGPIPIYKNVTMINKPEIGKEICDLLGKDFRGVILQGHGGLAVGPTIEDAIYVATQLEQAAYYQWMAKCVGKIVPLTEKELKDQIDYHMYARQPGHGGARVFDYYEWKVKMEYPDLMRAK